MSSEQPIVSVVIPVLNDEDILPLCLAAIEKQTLARSDFEVMVVDNGSRRDVAELLAGRFPRVRFLKEMRPGSYLARNAGAGKAKGKFVAFTDADCVPDPDWLRNALALFERHPGLAYLAGRIEVFPRKRGEANLVERFEMHTAFRQKEYLEGGHYGATANVIVNREVIQQQVGWFDEAAERGDDAHWGHAIFAHGLSQRYADDVIVGHPARHSLKQVVNKHRREAGHHFYGSLHGVYGVGRWRLLWSHLLRDLPPRRSRYNWWLAGERRNYGTIAAILAVGTAIHYCCMLDKVRLTFGGQPLPR